MNIARDKPAFQSSVSYGGVPSRAVDGVTSTNYNAGSCTATAMESDPWWGVDLQAEYRVQDLLITNRGDCCGKSCRQRVTGEGVCVCVEGGGGGGGGGG